MKKYYLNIVFLILVTHACAQKVNISAGLIAYYPFSGNAKDFTSNHNDGEVFGAMPTHDKLGNCDNAYYFDGLNDYILIKHSDKLTFNGDFTVSVWFKTEYALPFAAILGKIPKEEPRNGYIICINNNKKLRADICFDHSKSDCGTSVSGDTVVDNQWHHTVFLYNGDTVKLYLDGNLCQTINYSKGMQPNEEPLIIGWDRNQWMSHRHFMGTIDELRIYNRALNENEIKYLFEHYN